MPESPSFLVQWKSRVLLPGKNLVDGVISQAHKGGFELHIDRLVSIGSDIAIEFYVRFRDEPHRIRLKAKVTACRTITSGDALLNVTISQISQADNHTLNNVIQTLGDSGGLDKLA